MKGIRGSARCIRIGRSVNHTLPLLEGARGSVRAERRGVMTVDSENAGWVAPWITGFAVMAPGWTTGIV